MLNLVSNNLNMLFLLNPDYSSVIHVGRFGRVFLSYDISLLPYLFIIIIIIYYVCRDSSISLCIGV